MSGLFSLILGMQGITFAVWAVLMFRTLFRLRARAVAESGSQFPGPGATLRSFGAFLKAPEYGRDRWMLGAVTLLLFVLIGCVVMLASGQGPR